MADGGFIHITYADKRADIAAMGEGKKCERANCPGPEGWECGFGMAGGGYGSYSYCNTCDHVKEKDVIPDEDA